MKKSFLTIILFVGFVGVNAMADDTITISGTVLPAAVVGFSDVSGETLNANDRFIDATIDMGTTELNTPFTTITKKFYTKSNNPNGVQIKIKPHAGENASGDLTSSTGEILNVNYLFNFNNYTMDSTVTLTTEDTAGDTAGYTFMTIPHRPTTQTAGIYDTVLDVAVICP